MGLDVVRPNIRPVLLDGAQLVRGEKVEKSWFRVKCDFHLEVGQKTSIATCNVVLLHQCSAVQRGCILAGNMSSR